MGYPWSNYDRLLRKGPDNNYTHSKLLLKILVTQHEKRAKKGPIYTQTS
jgi:hypothetical protein